MNIFKTAAVLLKYAGLIENPSRGSDAIVKFETLLAASSNNQHVLTTASGTDALLISLKALNVRCGDEVIVPALGFASTAAAVAWIGGTPIFSDIEPGSLNLDPKMAEKAITAKTKGIIATHLNGRMSDMEPLSEITKKRGLFLIEDGAQAIGSQYKGKSMGFYSDLAVVSFNETKILRGIGDGGAIITKSEALAAKIRLLRAYGASAEALSINHEEIGIKSMLSPMQAVLLTERLTGLSESISRWRSNYYLYRSLLEALTEIELPDEDDGYCVNGYRFWLKSKKRDSLYRYLKSHNIDVRVHYSKPLPDMEAFHAFKKASFPYAESAANELLILPNSDSLGIQEIVRIAHSVKNFFAG